MVSSLKNQLYLMELLIIISGTFSVGGELLTISDRYSKENATAEEVRQAASEANALGFIERNEFGITLFQRMKI